MLPTILGSRFATARPYAVALCALATVWAFGPTTALGQDDVPTDATNPTDAAGLIANTAAGVEVSRAWCGKTFPDLKQSVDVAALTWRGRNSPVLQILAVQKPADLAAAKTAAAAAFQPVQSLNRDQQTLYCRQFAAVMPTGALDVAQRTPKAAELTAEYLRAHPLTEHQARGFNFELTCLRASANQKADLDAAQSFCGCTWSAMDSAFSADEWRVYDAAIAAKQSVAKLPQMQRAAPALQACGRLSSSSAR